MLSQPDVLVCVCVRGVEFFVVLALVLLSGGHESQRYFLMDSLSPIHLVRESPHKFSNGFTLMRERPQNSLVVSFSPTHLVREHPH